ncbi:hypothetical protein BJX63DRAFT_376105 [Aspergillus granulosus]|uniref:Secreted protein n=1 Tax=Aspergillus granulosus TaxID=176169 RepID=A0ABR4I5L0_9EURO
MRLLRSVSSSAILTPTSMLAFRRPHEEKEHTHALNLTLEHLLRTIFSLFSPLTAQLPLSMTSVRRDIRLSSN